MPYTDPSRQRAAQRESARRRRAKRADGSTPRRTRSVEPGEPSSLPHAARIATASDVVGVLSAEVARVRNDDSLEVLARARVIGQLAGVALRAVEVADLEERMVALEERLALEAAS